jgi:hypothetical protein
LRGELSYYSKKIKTNLLLDVMMISDKTAMFACAMLAIGLVYTTTEDNLRVFAQPFTQVPIPRTNVPSTANVPSTTEASFNGNISDLYSSKTKTFILSGPWSLNITQGRSPNFVANIFAVTTNGSSPHTHLIAKFRQSNNTLLQLNPDNNIVIHGVANVGFNKNPSQWPNVNTTISIYQGKAISIKLDNSQTGEHFANTPIYGVVNKATITSKIVNP